MEEENYKKQLGKCLDNETAFIEKCFVCGYGTLMCRKYGGQCHSDKCKLNKKYVYKRKSSATSRSATR